MNIRWSALEQRFEAEFSSDFNGDLEAVKLAKFHTTGPPYWIWFAPSPGIMALNRLRVNRPASGLTISEEALQVYNTLAEVEAKNDEVRKQLAEVKKAAKKERKQKGQKAANRGLFAGLTEEKWWIGAEDLPPLPPYISIFVPPPPPNLKCLICQSPVYLYEYEDVPMCLWCAKTSVK